MIAHRNTSHSRNNLGDLYKCTLKRAVSETIGKTYHGKKLEVSDAHFLGLIEVNSFGQTLAYIRVTYAIQHYAKIES